MGLFNFDSKQNIFTTILSLLDVNYTEKYSNKFFNEHPNKYTMWGLSQMLSNYGIINAGVKVENKEKELFDIQLPFIAHTGGDFVAVSDVNRDEVKYRWYGKNMKVTPDKFCSLWSGFILLVEKGNNAIEPQFFKNRKIELFDRLQKILLLSIACALVVFVYFVNFIGDNLYLTVCLLLNLIGLYVSYLLVQKQLHIRGNYADKICSLFMQGDCNDILDSKASKLFNVIGWSEIGLGYFVSNTATILLFSEYISYLVLINICAIPFCVWSVWYQKFKAKQWCPLCLIVQAILLLILVNSILGGLIQRPLFSAHHIFIVSCIYSLPVLVFSLLVSNFANHSKIESVHQEINSMKANSAVFLALLKQQYKYNVNEETSSIIFGDRNAQVLVSILTNPHCEPCAIMHNKVEALLNLNKNIKVQYIFSSFNEKLEDSNKYLIQIYLENVIDNTRKIYSDWFNGQKKDLNNFSIKYDLNPSKSEVTKEFTKHEIWRNTAQIQATPTILVNGYKLPDSYKLEDLAFIADSDLII